MKLIFRQFIIAIIFLETSACKGAFNPTSVSNFTPTNLPPITITQEVIDYSPQESIVLKSKFDKLYSYNQQVIDNYLSLFIEEEKPICHKKGDTAIIKFNFKNLSQSTFTISNRFALSPASTSYYVGADITPVFFTKTGERIHPSGDFSFIEYIPETNTFIELSARESLETTLEIEVPNKVWKEEYHDMIYFPAGYYFLKFIYWSAEVNRMADYEFVAEKRAVGSNTIVICIK